LASPITEVMDGDSNDAVAFLVASLDLIPDPWPVCGFLSDADHGYGTPREVVVDPALDGTGNMRGAL